MHLFQLLWEGRDTGSECRPGGLNWPTLPASACLVFSSAAKHLSNIPAFSEFDQNHSREQGLDLLPGSLGEWPGAPSLLCKGSSETLQLGSAAGTWHPLQFLVTGVARRRVQTLPVETSLLRRKTGFSSALSCQQELQTRLV